MTIKQLIDAQQPHPDADFKIDGTDLTQITFVGQIRNVSKQATFYTYKLDDGTGTMEVKQWIDPESNPDDGLKPELGESAYARVWGRLKQFNNKRHVGAVVIRPVTDFNEVQYHLLEATAVHLYFTKGPLGGAKQADGGLENGYGHDSGMNGANKSMPAGLSAGARKMYACLKDGAVTNEGLHVQDLAVRANMDIADVGKAADELLNHGMVYTTVDDQTWAILEDI